MNIKTAEYARKGHPDRTCDILSDAILDEYLKQDKMSRCAIEVFGAHGIVYVAGEVTSTANVNVPKIVKEVYKEIGYKDNVGVQVNIIHQSKEIGELANTGAGDSGIVTGYATSETKEMLPLETALAKRVADAIDANARPWIFPDGKIQVTIQNDKVTDIVISYQCYKKIDKIIKEIASNVISTNINSDTKWVLIPFQIGGFEADTGLTGRKNVLWYGPSIPIGGGAFAGKDATKVDRSGAYLARNIAKKRVEDGENKECFVEIAYAMGDDKPLYVKIVECGIEMQTIAEEQLDDVSVSNTIHKFDMRKPIYKEASLKGHFGYDSKWEK